MGKNKLNIIILTFLTVAIFYPLLMMLLNVEWSNFEALITSIDFRISLKNSMYVTPIATILSVLLAYLLAYSINHANIKHKSFLRLLLTLPMLIPSISHGLGLINLFGRNGIISRLFNFDIIGSTGIIIGSVLYSFPIAFLILDDGFNYINNDLYDTAKVLGLNKFQTFKTVTLSYMKKPIFSSIFAIFTLIFTDYGVPLAVGGQYITLPVFLYKEVIGLLDFSTGTMIGLFLLIPAIISFIFDNLTKDYTKSENDRKKYKIEKNKKRDLFLNIFIYIVIVFILCIIGSFVYYAFVDNPVLNNKLSLKHFKYIIDNSIFKNLANSIIISVLTAVFGTNFSYFAAYSTARTNSKNNKIIHLLTISSLAIPGVVLGLAYTIGFRDLPIYNTIFILVMVNIVHFLATPYLMAYNALKKVDENYEIVGKTCSIGRIKIIKDVIIPCTRKTIREMFAYFFVNSMITISAVAFLFNTKNMPLSLLINTYEGNMMLGEAAIISLIILIINVIIKSIVYLLNKIDYRKELEYEN